MSDLTAAQWREIESAAVNAYVASDTDHGRMIWCIELGKLRTIIKRSRRSLPQNSLLHALIDDARDRAGETLGGWSHEDVYEFLLGEWSGWELQEGMGQKRKKPKRRSSRLSKVEMGEFINFVVEFFGRHGIVLELPGEQAA